MSVKQSILPVSSVVRFSTFVVILFILSVKESILSLSSSVAAMDTSSLSLNSSVAAVGSVFAAAR